MKQDIDFPSVQGVYTAVARTFHSLEAQEWSVYLINNNDFALKNILITSKGYGFKDDQKQKTSIIRQHISILEPKSYAQIERIVPEVFHLYNEYWVSYYLNDQIYDKKFIFVPESIREEHLTQIEILNLEGILHT
ncbi:MAG: hypothetical protein NW226_11880 [Microscillaceae bacterium]|nr:hypothetical protein [Microscillaceae bacterium]